MGAPLGRSTLGVGLLLLSLLRPAVGAAGPSTQKPTLRIERIATSPPTKVRIYLSDLDENGLVIPPATPRPYQLLVNGQRLPNAAQVETFGKLGEPMALTMVIQCSPIFGSAFADLKAGLLQLLDLVPPSSQVGLIAYADGVISELKPTSVKAARDALQALQIKEDAIELELPDGVRDGLAQLSQANLPERRVLVVVSDGLAAELKFGAFTKLGGDAASRGIRIHAVGYAPIDDTPLRTLTELSKRSGGTMRPSTNVPDMKAALVALADELRHQRVLEYDLPQLFTGKVTDFQIEAGADLATDAVQIDLPLVEPPGFRSLGFGVGHRRWPLVPRRRRGADDPSPAPSGGQRASCLARHEKRGPRFPRAHGHDQGHADHPVPSRGGASRRQGGGAGGPQKTGPQRGQARAQSRRQGRGQSPCAQAGGQRRRRDHPDLVDAARPPRAALPGRE
jgi:hypothetical protein